MLNLKLFCLFSTFSIGLCAPTKDVLLDMLMRKPNSKNFAASFLESFRDHKVTLPIDALFNLQKGSCVDQCIPDWSEALPRTTSSIDDIWNNINMDQACL